MSYFTKARAPGYYNNLLSGTEDDFMKLVKRYSICPPNEIGGYRGKDLGQITADDNATEDILKLRGSDVRLARVEKDSKVGYIDLRLKPRGDFTVTGNEGGDHIYFDATYDHNQTANGYIPIWYLPWDSSGASIRLTIPPVGTHTGPDDPDIFFTAAINGCSIFFQGTTQNPTIYHCGGGTGYGNNQLDEAAEFWQTIMDEFIGFDQNRGKNKGALSDNSVDKRDYIKQTGVNLNNVPTTKRAKTYYNVLKAKHGLGKLMVRDVNAWGCVLGRRDANGDWKFYLQENATVVYKEVTRKLSNRLRAEISQQQMVSRPLSIKEIFPAGSRHATIRSGVPSIL